MVSYPLFAFLKTSLKPSILHVNDSHLSLECMSFSRALTLSTSFFVVSSNFFCVSPNFTQAKSRWSLMAAWRCDSTSLRWIWSINITTSFYDEHVLVIYTLFYYIYLRYKSGNTWKLKLPFICEDSGRIFLKHDFLFHCHFTENH